MQLSVNGSGAKRSYAIEEEARIRGFVGCIGTARCYDLVPRPSRDSLSLWVMWPGNRGRD